MNGLEPVEARQIFINDISGDTTTSDLRNVFAAAGKVTNVEIDTNELNRHFAFVTFETSQGVQQAISKFTTTNLNNTTLVCRRRTELEQMRQKRMIEARCKLFVGNIPQQMSPNDLRREIERLSGRPIADFRHKKGYCFVGYSTPQDAEDAKRNLKNAICGGKSLNAEFKKEDPIRNEPGFIAVLEQAQRTLYVRDIPPHSSPDNFKKIFELYGKVRKFTLPTENRSNKLVGYAFIEYFWKEDCDKALKQTENLLIDGVKIEIRISDPPKDKASSNRDDRRGNRRDNRRGDNYRRDLGFNRRDDRRGDRDRNDRVRHSRFNRNRSRSRSRSRSRDRHQRYNNNNNNNNNNNHTHTHNTRPHNNNHNNNNNNYNYTQNQTQQQQQQHSYGHQQHRIISTNNSGIIYGQPSPNTIYNTSITHQPTNRYPIQQPPPYTQQPPHNIYSPYPQLPNTNITPQTQPNNNNSTTTTTNVNNNNNNNNTNTNTSNTTTPTQGNKTNTTNIPNAIVTTYPPNPYNYNYAYPYHTNPYVPNTTNTQPPNTNTNNNNNNNKKVDNNNSSNNNNNATPQTAIQQPPPYGQQQYVYTPQNIPPAQGTKQDNGVTSTQTGAYTYYNSVQPTAYATNYYQQTTTANQTQIPQQTQYTYPQQGNYPYTNKRY